MFIDNWSAVPEDLTLDDGTSQHQDDDQLNTINEVEPIVEGVETQDADIPAPPAVNETTQLDEAVHRTCSGRRSRPYLDSIYVYLSASASTFHPHQYESADHSLL